MEFFAGFVGVLSILGIPYLANKRGRSPFLFFLLTLVIGPLSMIFLFMSNKKTKKSIDPDQPYVADNLIRDVDGTFGNVDHVKPTDGRTAMCPSCGFGLNKVPGAKTKCPHCGAHIYVRTNPTTNSRVLVTVERAEEIDDEWAKINGTGEMRETAKRRYKETKERLTNNFNGEIPSENDIKWSLLNEDLIRHSSIQDWGLYRNTIFEMGEILRKEGKHTMALEKYLLVCYIDTCGPNNISTPLGTKNEFGQMPFSKGNAFLAPGVLERILKSAKKLEKDLDSLKVILMNVGAQYQGAIPFTMPPEESWEEIIKELKRK